MSAWSSESPTTRQVGQWVGCEDDDGLIVVHPERETCAVCQQASPVSTSAESPANTPVEPAGASEPPSDYIDIVFDGPADAALLRERDAQIEALKVANASFTAAATVRVEDALDQIASLMAQRDDAQAACHEWSAIVKQCDLDATTLRAELDAAQQERDSIATQLHAEIASERERRVAAQEAIALKYVPELEAARQQITTLTEALDVAAQDIRDWVKTARGLRDRVADPDHDPSTPHLRGIAESEQVLTRIYAALSSPPRPQEPQPAEPKSSETRKPVVNLMEALKKSLDSLNANRTSQEPGGHQP